jgi:hypothetical protein
LVSAGAGELLRLGARFKKSEEMTGSLSLETDVHTKQNSLDFTIISFGVHSNTYDLSVRSTVGGVQTCLSRGSIVDVRNGVAKCLDVFTTNSSKNDVITPSFRTGALNGAPGDE